MLFSFLLVSEFNSSVQHFEQNRWFGEIVVDEGQEVVLVVNLLNHRTGRRVFGVQPGPGMKEFIFAD